MPLICLTAEGKQLEKANVFKVVARRGVERVGLEEGTAGDIIGIAGFSKATATMTLCEPTVTTPLPCRPIDPPVLSMLFTVNKSPFAGKEGTHTASIKLKQRLYSETESNISIVLGQQTEDAYEIKGRGELQLAILLENMRREGYEVVVSQPRILMKKDEHGELVEPIEEVSIEINAEQSGWLLDVMTKRKGDVTDSQSAGERMRFKFLAPSRSLLGFRSYFMNETRGEGIISHTFHAYEKFKGSLDIPSLGALISSSDGVTTSFALNNLEQRGVLYVGPGQQVYTGQIIGINSRDDDLDVNPCKLKQLTNVRSVQKEEAIKLAQPKPLTLELALSVVKADELVEITPKSIRLRKKELNQNVRRKNEKSGKRDDDDD